MLTFINIYLIIGLIVAGIETLTDVRNLIKYDFIKSIYYENSSLRFWAIMVVIIIMLVIRFILCTVTWPIITIIKVKEAFTEVF